MNRVAAKSIAAIPAGSIPFLGVAVLAADTGYELYAACETMRDLDKLYLELGVQEEASGDAIHSVCNPELPDAGEVWDGVVEKSGEWLDQARGAMFPLVSEGVVPDQRLNERRKFAASLKPSKHAISDTGKLVPSRYSRARRYRT